MSHFPVYTIGHSNHPIERFLDLLRAQDVTALADVRSSPWSRHAPQFNRETLKAALEPPGIAYAFLGRELGARPDDPACIANGRVQYARLASTALFRSGLDRVLQGAATHRLALLCAEKEPLDCHRTLLIARELARRGIAVAHILEDCRVEPHEATMDRLLELEGLGGADRFQSREEKLCEACASREEQITHTS